MDTYFFDSSALVKRYVTETGTDWVSGIVDPSNASRIFIARITAVEVVSAIARRFREGSLSDIDMKASLTRFRRELLTIYLPIEISQNLISLAMTLAEAYALRGYDAVQLAGALEVHNVRLGNSLTPPTLISADAALNAAALAEGMTVDDPNAH
ncbi:MAG: type II toxin-antitoxin system VapC family toxin [Pyrinomonadaceae bacterium]